MVTAQMRDIGAEEALHRMNGNKYSEPWPLSGPNMSDKNPTDTLQNLFFFFFCFPRRAEAVLPDNSHNNWGDCALVLAPNAV